MSMHEDWTTAKKDSKTKFKQATKAKSKALEKQIKAGDAKARKKALDDSLSELGLTSGDDVDKYFSFKLDLGPNLDKFEKRLAKGKAIQSAIDDIKSIDQVIKNSKLSKACGKFAKAAHVDEIWLFVTAGYKLDPVKAYALFIKQGAPYEINLDGKDVQPLHQLAGNPEGLKAQGGPLLKKCREALIDQCGLDFMRKFKSSSEFKAVFGEESDLSGLKTKILTAVKTYKKLIEDSEDNWKNISPDFRQPLLDALAKIKADVNNA